MSIRNGGLIMKKKVFLLVSVILLAASCSNGTTSQKESSISVSSSAEPVSSSEVSSESLVSSSKESKPVSSSSSVKPTSERFKKNFKFKYFTDEGREKGTKVTDGLIHYEHTMSKTNGDKTVFHTLEIDLSKVNIVAGSKDNESVDHTFPNKLEVPHKMATAYTKDTGKQVFASINADFFNPDPAVGKAVNAFVKDGFIIKDGHNDNNSYDYTKDYDDVPASWPMLFGIKDNEAIVAPIFADNGKDPLVPENKKEYVKTTLSYTVYNGASSFKIGGKNKFTAFETKVNANDLVYVVDISKGAKEIKVIDNYSAKKGTLPACEKGQAYFVFSIQDSAASKFANKITKQSTLSLEISNGVDDTWTGADTILGCRHNLIKDNEIAPTLEKEYSNGAANPIVPKSAVGVREDGIVVVFAVEGLKYGKKGTADDPVGVSLPELAEFMSYSNILNGANFDGGGSVQLIVKDAKDGDKVCVRSSDTGSYELDSTRKVANALLVTER